MRNDKRVRDPAATASSHPPVMLSGRFAALRMRHAGGNSGKAQLRPLEWLLVEWPAHEQEPSKYVLTERLIADKPVSGK